MQITWIMLHVRCWKKPRARKTTANNPNVSNVKQSQFFRLQRIFTTSIVSPKWMTHNKNPKLNWHIKSVYSNLDRLKLWAQPLWVKPVKILTLDFCVSVCWPQHTTGAWAGAPSAWGERVSVVCCWLEKILQFYKTPPFSPSSLCQRGGGFSVCEKGGNNQITLGWNIVYIGGGGGWKSPHKKRKPKNNGRPSSRDRGMVCCSRRRGLFDDRSGRCWDYRTNTVQRVSSLLGRDLF